MMDIALKPIIQVKPEGLSSDYVRACAKDKKGGLWFGTNNGLTKFDLIPKSFKPSIPMEVTRLIL